MYDLLKALEAGELVIYPTETLYGVGCDGTNAEACEKLKALKGRAKNKPLPLIIGSMKMLSQVTNEIPNHLLELAGQFWPGPLSILVKALPELPEILSDDEGYTSVRWSGHPFASELARRLKKPIVATSANFSGGTPVALPEDLDPELMDKVKAVYLDPPWPKGKSPSTVVRMVGATKLEVIREGAISISKLCSKGYTAAQR